MPLFNNRPKIFRNKNLLESDHLPDSFESRERELNAYQDALYPVYAGEKPKNIFLYGDSGTGKTSLTKYILNHLETDAADQGVDVTWHYVSCSQLKNTYQLAIKITNTLREHRYGHTENNLSKKGHSKPDVIDSMFNELEHTTGTQLLVLDEINNVQEYDLLYEIPRARSNNRLSQDSFPPGIIGISNDVDYLNKLPPKIKDTLNHESIRFDPYGGDTLKQILESRAETAFYDVLDNDVIPFCAALASQENGSARRALRLLRDAGEIARNQHDNTVTEDHVRLAEEKLDRELVKEAINAGTVQTQLALLTVALAASKEQTPERTSNLHNSYTTIANNSGHNHLKHDRFRQRLDTLTEKNITNRDTKNDDGRYSEYWLNKDLLVILDALSNEPEFIDTITTCVNHAYQNNILTDDDIETLEL